MTFSLPLLVVFSGFASTLSSLLTTRPLRDFSGQAASHKRVARTKLIACGIITIGCCVPSLLPYTGTLKAYKSTRLQGDEANLGGRRPGSETRPQEIP